MRRIWWISCCTASSCSSFSMRAVSVAMSLMLKSLSPHPAGRASLRAAPVDAGGRLRHICMYCLQKATGHPCGRSSQPTSAACRAAPSSPRCSSRATTAGPTTRRPSTHSFRPRWPRRWPRRRRPEYRSQATASWARWATRPTSPSGCRALAATLRASRRWTWRRCRSYARSSPRSWASRSSCARAAWARCGWSTWSPATRTSAASPGRWPVAACAAS